jgi:competence protein ComEC
MFAITLGLTYAISYGLYAKSHQLQILPKETITLVGKISNLPIHKHDKVKFSLNIKEIQNNSPLKRILVSWYKSEEELQVGQIWQLEVKLKPIHGYNNPGSFDYSKWLFRHGYDATATVRKGKLITPQFNDILTQINLLRASISQLIDVKFQSPRVQALIKALTIGDKSQISYEDSQLFQDTGTAHLIAISGLHIGLMAFLGVLFGRLLFYFLANEKFNRFKVEAIFAIVLAAFYALLAGLSVPTIRALVMIVVFSIAYALNKQINRWQAWSIALITILIFDPLSVLDVGFWFSFTAVAVLMFAFSGRKFSHNKIITFAKAQWVILIGLMPIMILVFGKINLLTPLANLMVLPLASLLLIPLMFAAFMTYLFSNTLANFLFELVETLAQLLFAILDELQQLNFLSLSISHIGTITILSVSLMTLILLLPKLFRWRYLSLLLIFPVIFSMPKTLKTKEFQVIVLDVGQGLSIVVKSAKHTLIYDTGAKYDTGFNLASVVVIPYLHSLGINNIDKLLLSHQDNDHAGGVKELMAEFPEMQVYDVNGEYHACKKGLSWQWDEVSFEVLSPYNITPYMGNNSSCVLKISSQLGSILFTGDIEEPIEYRLLHQSKAKLTSDVLVIPHHGSKTSSSQDFIQQVNPKIALNSSGYSNQFNHPHPMIRQRYIDNGIRFYDTQERGMIELLFSKIGISIEQYSDINPHFWQVSR